MSCVAVGYLGESNIQSIGAANEAARAATVPALHAQIMALLPDLYAAGFPQSTVTIYAVAQMMLESDWMTSNVANTDNNYTGITWINKPYQNATKGIAKPASDGGGNYAHYATFKDWAADFLRVLSLNTGGKGRPIDATSAAQYGERLMADHYFTDPAYTTKFNAALKKVNEALAYGQKQDKQYVKAVDSGQTTFTYTAGQGLSSNTAFNADRAKTGLVNWWSDLPWYGQAGLVTGGFLVLIVAIKS